MSAHLGRADAVGDCARLLRAVDRRVDALGARDAAAPRVPGFPYLRVDRFTAWLGRQLGPGDGDAAARAWVGRMAALDREAREVERLNAEAADPAGATASAAKDLPAHAAVDACRDRLAAADLAGHAPAVPAASGAPGTPGTSSVSSTSSAALRQAAQVPDDYSTAARVAGLYALTRVPFAAGVRAYEAATRASFAQPLEALPRLGTLQRYRPAGLADLADLPRSLSGLPAAGLSAATAPGGATAVATVTAATWAAWIARHAPELEIDSETDADRPGALQWRRDERGAPVLAVDTAQPQATVRVAFMPFDGRPRAQIVYTFWFPRRPAQSAVDVLAGELDALVWRATLDDDGEALLYDSMHACGCYHQFFPTARVRARPRHPDASALDEAMFAPQATLPAPRAGERVHLRVAARTHYLQRVLLVPADAAAAVPAPPYGFRDDDALRRLPLPGGGQRSAFDARGLMPGSERAERWLFWPMGIASAGQMRQWGRHATAFVGRRHFDDAELLDRYFERVPGAGEP
jgi:hypothetical protein